MAAADPRQEALFLDAWDQWKATRNVSPCPHYEAVRAVHPRSSECVLCVATGGSWIQLCMCLTCGQVGCSDDSENRHAMKHYEETDHPIVTSRGPGKTWRWCYVDERYV
jgi:CPA2 family monovalent cation:H+ antiporter-2